MSYSFNLRQKRITDPDSIDREEIDRALNDGMHVIVQFSKLGYSDRQLSELNALCEIHGIDFGVRFYGHYSGSFDCRTLRRIPNVKCLYVDCLTRSENIEEITRLDYLQKLHLGIYEMKEPDILQAENFRNLRELVISETRSKALDLEPLRDYNQLKLLVIGGHTKHIEAIGELDKLEYLGLNSIKRTQLHFVNDLKSLRTLKIILGGRENFNEIGDNEIEHLEIIWVRGFNDLSNISRFKRLRTLSIEGEIRLKEIEFDKEMEYLADIKIFNCKNLTSLSGLSNLSWLNQLRVSGTGIDFGMFKEQAMPKSLKTLAFYTGKKKANERIGSEIFKMGYNEHQ